MKKILIFGSFLILGASLQAMTMKSKIDIAKELRTAAERGDLPMLRSLLAEKELDLTLLDDMGNSALHYAAAAGQAEALAVLLDYAEKHKVAVHTEANTQESSEQKAWEAAGASIRFLNGTRYGALAPMLLLLYSGVILKKGADKPHFENPENPLTVLKELNAYALTKGKVLKVGVLEGSPESNTLAKGAYPQLQARVFVDEDDAMASLTDAHDLYALFIGRSLAETLTTRKPLVNYSGILLKGRNTSHRFHSFGDPLTFLQELNAYALAKRVNLTIGVLSGSHEERALTQASAELKNLKAHVFLNEADAVKALRASKHGINDIYALFIQADQAAGIEKVQAEANLVKRKTLNFLNGIVLEGVFNTFLEPDAQRAEREKHVHAIPWIDLTNIHASTALHYAVAGGHLPCVQLLLDRRANSEVCAVEAKTPVKNAPANKVLASCYPGRPLHVACQLGHADIAELLLQWGVDKEALDAFKRTPLHAAAMGGSKKIVCMLLEADVDAKKNDTQGKTAQQCAHDKGHYALAAYFLSCTGGIKTINESHLGVMHYAAMADDCDLARTLEKEGALINLKDIQGFMPIYYAAQMGKMKMLNWCLDHAPFIPHSAVSLLCVAARAGQMAAAETIIDRGEDVLCGMEVPGAGKAISIFDEQAVESTNDTDFDFAIPEISYMLWALEERLPDFVDLLIKKGVKETPEIALTRELWKKVRSKTDLLRTQKGLRKDYPDVHSDEAFPLHYAAEGGHKNFVSSCLRVLLLTSLFRRASRASKRKKFLIEP